MEKPTRRWAIGTAVAGAFAVVASARRSAATSSENRERGETMKELNDNTLEQLIKQAKSASEKAYVPYSKFRVGAAVLTDSGEVFTGCNVENASYGLTICAERNAVFHMVAQAKQKITTLVVYTPTPTPSAPCGACRQVINEFGPDALIVSVCDGPDMLKKNLSALLPDAFGPANLK
jgi:cytidine deaminase